MADGDLGTARGKVIIDADMTGLDDAQKGFDKFGKKAEDAGNKVRDVKPLIDKTSNAALVGGGLIAAGFAVAIKTASDFQTQLSELQAVSGATTDEMGKINTAALRIGKDTAYSATEAASAMTELVKAGISVNDVLNGAADATVSLAAAGGVALPEAATIAANAMNQFGLTAQQMPKIADLIAGAANASAIDVSQFGYSLSQVGAVANLAGVTFEDTATAIALMGNAGIVGSDAGTSLKAMFMRLNPQTKEAYNLMMDLGIITEDGANKFYDASGKMKSLADVSQILQDALAGMTEQQKQATLTTLFGSDAIRGAAILAKDGAAGFDQMAASMGKVKAADVAKTRMDNLKGSIEQLKGSLETLLIMIGQTFLPFIQKMVGALTDFFGKVISLPGPVIQIGVALAAAVGGGLLLMGMLGKLTTSFLVLRDALLLATGAEKLFGSAGAFAAAKTGLLSAAQAVLNTVMKANPILLIISLIAGLIAIIVSLTGSWKDVGKIFKPVADAFKKGFEEMLKAAQPLVKMFTQIGSAVSKSMAPILKQLGETLMPPIMALFKALVPILTSLTNLFFALVKPIVGLLAPAFQVIGALLGALMAILGPIIQLLANILTPIFEALGWVLNLVAQGIQWVVDRLNEFFNGGFDTMMSNLGTAWDGVYKKYIKPFWDNMVAAAKPVYEWYKNTVEPGLKTLGENIAKGWETFKTSVKDAWEQAQASAKPVYDWFHDTALPLLKGALEDMKKSWDDFKGGIKDAWESAQAAALPVYNWFHDTAIPGIKGAIDGMQTTWDNLKKGATDAFTNLLGAAQPAADAFEKLKTKAGELWDKLVEKAEPIVTKVSDFLQKIQDKWQGLVDKVQPIVDKFSDMWQKLQDKLAPILDKIGSLFGHISDAISKIFGGGGSAEATPGAGGQAASDTETKGQALLDFLGKFAESAVFGTLETVFNTLSNAIDAVGVAFDIMSNTISWAWNNIAIPIWNAVKPVVEGAMQAAKNAIQWLKDNIGPIWEGIKTIVKNAIDKIGDTIDNIKDFVDKIPGFFNNVKKFIQDPFAGAREWLKDAGSNIIAGLKAGIESAINSVKSLLKGVTNLIPSWKGPMELDKKLLTPNGKAIMQSLISGLQSEVGNLHGMLGGLNVSIPADVSQQLTLAGAAGQGSSNSRTLQYYAAPGSSQLSGEEELFTAMRRSKVVVPGW